MRKTVNQIYTYAKNNSTSLLGTNSFDFWADYVSNYSIYDRYFRDTFLKFYYWIDFDEDSTDETIFTDFTEAVQSHLYINAKRYSELYQVQSLADDAYDIVNNYDLTENSTRLNTGTVSNAAGAQDNSYTKGASTATDSYGADTRTLTEGAQTNTETHTVSPYDTSDLSNDTEITTDAGEKTTTDTKAAKIDTHSTIAVTDSETIGEKTDTRTDNLSESITLTRKGNIGVATAAQIIGGHIDLWERFNFFKMIFDNIAKEYLLVSDDYTAVYSGSSSSDSSAVLAAINALSLKLDDIEESINTNIDEAEANIRGDIVEVSTDGY